MEPLPPIPSPPSHYWREFKVKALPFLVFLGVLVAVAFLWNKRNLSGTIVGEIEALQGAVISPQAGTVRELKVELFQKVTAGQPIATIIATSPDALRASLAIISNAQEYEQLRVDWMNQKVTLSIANVNLRQAKSEFQRVEKLFQDKYASQEVYDTARAAMEALEVQVTERGQLVREMGESLERLRPIGENQATNASTTSLATALAAQEKELQATGEPLVLTAPMDGIITKILRRAGENTVEGEPLVIISVPASRHIIGHLRQPFPLRPQIGMPVQVSTRGTVRQEATAHVLNIGSQMETVGPHLRTTVASPMEERSLPIQISLPPELKVLPGELVDLSFR